MQFELDRDQLIAFTTPQIAPGQQALMIAALEEAGVYTTPISTALIDIRSAFVLPGADVDAGGVDALVFKTDTNLDLNIHDSGGSGHGAIVATGHGDDTLVNHASGAMLLSGYGDDVLSTTVGDTLFFSGKGDDYFPASELGGNVLFAGCGADVMEGSKVYSEGDTIFYDYFIGGFGADSITSLAGGAAVVGIGGQGGDSLVAEGAASLFGGFGDDVISSGSDYNLLAGNAGNDSMSAEANAIMYGGYGNDSMVSGSGSNQLYGGQGNDTLVSYSGPDATGTTSLYGGAGDDIFGIMPGATATHSISGDDGYDTLYLPGRSASDAFVTYDADQGLYSIYFSDQTLYVTGVELFVLDDGAYATPLPIG
ncbi:hypothetical protein [Bosea sp. 117]|uniref:calcium-binding protein n=1 Tax=Bosea sp. 117 TaxID=1125973 RepID=UPI000494C0FA|nr:hypothetical protein [Bosea sp. 117]